MFYVEVVMKCIWWTNFVHRVAVIIVMRKMKNTYIVFHIDQKPMEKHNSFMGSSDVLL